MAIFVMSARKQKSGAEDSHYWLHHDRPAWEASLRFPACQDTLTLVNSFQDAWKSCPQFRPVMVSVVLVDLIPKEMQNLTLFGEMHNEQKFDRLAETMDAINKKYGSTTLYLGGIHDVRKSAPPRIAFTSIPDMDLK